MIATKPASSSSVEVAFESAETAPLLDYDTLSANSASSGNAALPESLFYGLSFPDVPTQAPLVTQSPAKNQQAQQQQQVQQEVQQVQQQKGEQKGKEAWSGVGGYDAEEGLKPTAPPAYVKGGYQAVRREEETKTDLSALYAAVESPVTPPMYPPLPSLAMQTDVRDYDNYSSPSAKAAPEVQGASNERLVQELLEENAKLSREVLDLRTSLKVLADDDGPTVTPESNAPAEHRPQMASYTSDTSSEDGEAVTSTSQSVARSSASAPSASTANREQNRLKYVCCGSCSQWLQAPVDKTYVYCPQCGSVNDCSSVERRNEAEQQQRQPARRLPTMPWYQQCFARLTQFGT